MHYISTVSTLSQTNSNQSNSDRNLSNVSENNCKRKSDPTDDISNYQKKKSPKMKLYLNSLLIILNVQNQKDISSNSNNKKDIYVQSK